MKLIFNKDYSESTPISILISARDSPAADLSEGGACLATEQKNTYCFLLPGYPVVFQTSRTHLDEWKLAINYRL